MTTQAASRTDPNTTARALPGVDSLDSVSLKELVDRAALQTRVDRKYMVPMGEMESLLGRIGKGARVLEIDGVRSFSYESVYFDTPDLLSFMSAAHRRRRRFKVRTRTYMDSCACWLEVKTRGVRGSTVKDRVSYEIDDRRSVDPGRVFVDNVLARELIVGSGEFVFVPTLVTRYRRSTLLVPGIEGRCGESRATIDADLCWEAEDHRRLGVSDVVIVETKTGSVASRVDRLLWAGGFRPVRISKYATGLATLRPELPSTRWKRTIREYLAPCVFTPDSHTPNWQEAS